MAMPPRRIDDVAAEMQEGTLAVGEALPVVR